MGVSATDRIARAAELAAGAAAPQILDPRSIVIVGGGGIVRDAHLPAYQKAGFPVSAVIDVDPVRAEATARQFGVSRWSARVSELPASLIEASIFDVAVPAHYILDVLPQLPDGAAVLIQKPMGETLDEARAIAETCRRKNLAAAVNFQLRWAPVMLGARAITDAGLLGEIHDMQVEVNVHMPWGLWKFLSTAPRLEILYHSIHYVDLVRSWFGNPLGVYAKTVRNPRTPELAATKTVMILDYGEWKRVSIAANHHHDFSPAEQKSEVQWEGAEGAMRAVMGVNLDYPKGRPDTLRMVTHKSNWETLPTVGNWFPDAFIGSMASLQAYATGASKQLPTRVEDALDTMRVVEAAYISSAQGGVSLP